LGTKAKRTKGEPLTPEALNDHDIISAHCRRLDKDEEFRNDLLELLDYLKKNLKEIPLHPKEAEYVLAPLIKPFVEKWRIPRYQGDDAHISSPEQVIWRILRTWDGGSKFREFTPSFVMWMSDIGGRCVVNRIEHEGRTLNVVDHIPLIFPNQPLPFVWDPTCSGRDSLENRIRDILRDVESSIREQALLLEAQARKAGFARRPYREKRALWGELLYERNIKKKSWGQLKAKMRHRSRSYICKKISSLNRKYGISDPQKP